MTQQQQETTKEKIKNFVLGFGILCLIGWGFQYCGKGNDSSSGSFSSVETYPKTCKANCGYPITSKEYDYDGYHMACKRNGNKPSMMERVK